MTPLHVGSRFWLTDQGKAAIGREEHIRLDVSLKDIRVVLLNATLLAQIYRDADTPDAALEAALARIAQHVSLVDYPRHHQNGGAA